MKILIDEDMDVRLRRHLFPHYDAYTVEYMGWKSLSNGELLDKADGAAGKHNTPLCSYTAGAYTRELTLRYISP